MAQISGGNFVPTLLPQKIRSEKRRIKHVPAAESTEWAGLWSVSLALAALLIASIVYFAGHDKVGAAFVLIGTAIMIALVMRAGTDPNA
jgi:hypothetical protein